MIEQQRTDIAHRYDAFTRDSAWHFNDAVRAGFMNLGYFLRAADPISAACERLVERVIAHVSPADGPVLDVGCGLGGGTAILARHWPASRVHGVNISTIQLDECRRRVPDAAFHLMPAEALAFPDASFHTVVSIEAACHFDRRRFLTEAFRVLRPGGTLVVADILFDRQPGVFTGILRGQEIYATIAEYEALWRSCGFADVTCEDVTDPVWRGFARHCRHRAFSERAAKRLDDGTFRRAMRFAEHIATLPVSAYVIARATRR